MSCKMLAEPRVAAITSEHASLHDDFVPTKMENPTAEHDDVSPLPAKCYGVSKRRHKVKTRSQASPIINSPDVRVPTNIQSDRAFRSKSKRVLQLEKAMSKKK